MSRVWSLLVVPLSAVLLVSGCSSSAKKGDGNSSTSTSTSAATSSVPPSTPANGETLTTAQAQAALLSPTDVGASFTAVNYTATDQEAPCNPTGPTLEAAIPQTLRVGATSFSASLGASYSEELFAYVDAPTAASALSFLAGGVDCKNASLDTGDGSKVAVTFEPLQDITSQLPPAVKAVAVQASAAGAKIVLAAAQLGRLLVVFTFAADLKTADSALPNPISVAAKAVTKVATS